MDSAGFYYSPAFDVCTMIVLSSSLTSAIRAVFTPSGTIAKAAPGALSIESCPMKWPSFVNSTTSLGNWFGGLAGHDIYRVSKTLQKWICVIATQANKRAIFLESPKGSMT